MAFEKLSAAELAADPTYVKFLKNLKVGEGARATVQEEGVGKVTLKKRLSQAAVAAGVDIKFHRSDVESVVVEVVGRQA